MAKRRKNDDINITSLLNWDFVFIARVKPTKT